MPISRRSVMLSSLSMLAVPRMALAQKAGSPDVVAGIPVNYDEAKTGSFTLPRPLVMGNGRPVSTAAAWTGQRRPEIMRMFETQQFGRAPGRPAGMRFVVREEGTPALGGKAMRRQVRIQLTPDAAGLGIDLAVYMPAGAKGPVPVLLAIGFSSNAASVNDPGVAPGSVWDVKTQKRIPYQPGARGFGRIDPVPLLDAGIGFATFYYGDVEPDDLSSFAGGIRAHMLKAGQSAPAPDEWGAISAWAWGISRAVDYLETDKRVDAQRIAIYGVSRLGKTVMWAGANDPRIAATIASCSGEGGAALSRRNYGETVAHLVAPTRYPYQFAGNYAHWAGFPDRAPFDANLLVAAHAPRPLLLQTGTTDNWSDPKGEFLSAADAGAVYRLLGKTDLGTSTWPGAGQRIGGDLSYYMHEGGHGSLPTDWPVFLAFLQAHLKPEARA